jgi:aminopeptidase YwaD
MRFLTSRAGFLFLCLIPLAEPSLAAQVSRCELPDRVLLENIAGEVSGKICFEHIRDLSVLCKWYGSDDMQKGADRIASQARRYGLHDVRVEKFPVDADSYYFMQKPWNAWNCTSGELRMIAPRRALITSTDANALCVLVNSRNADVTAEVVYVGEGTRDADYAGRDVKGKLVLASGRPWPVAQIAIFKKKAAGILCSWGIDVPGPASTDIFQTPIPPWDESRSQPSTFGFFLSTDQGREILALLERGEKVVMHAGIEAEVRIPGFHQGVSAVIPGTEFPEQEIVFTAHLDHPRPGAHDNNSGCAVLLEVARSLSSLIAQGRIAPPRRSIRFFWTPHVWGVDMFYTLYPEKLAGAVASLNLDCVGLHQTKFSSAFTLVHTPFSRAGFLDDVVSNLLDYVIQCNNNHMGRNPEGPALYDHDGSRDVFHGREVPFMDYSDHVFFNSGGAGVPAVTFIDLPYPIHHSQNDELDALDPTQLKRVAFLAAASSYTLAAAGPRESFPIVDEIFHRGRARLERELRLVKNMLRGRHGPKPSVRLQAANNLIRHAVAREVQALESAALFAGDDPAAAAHIADRIRLVEKQDAFYLE